MFPSKKLKILKTYAGLFINYLKHKQEWEESKSTYVFGNSIKTSEKQVSKKELVEHHAIYFNPLKKVIILKL